jgi:hypothetical protein
MTDQPYDSTDAWAYGMLELVSTFVARSMIDKKGWQRLKELLPQYCGTSLEGRAVEAAIGQFMAQLDHINESI